MGVSAHQGISFSSLFHTFSSPQLPVCRNLSNWIILGLCCPFDSQKTKSQTSACVLMQLCRKAEHRLRWDTGFIEIMKGCLAHLWHCLSHTAPPQFSRILSNSFTYYKYQSWQWSRWILFKPEMVRALIKKPNQDQTVSILSPSSLLNTVALKVIYWSTLDLVHMAAPQSDLHFASDWNISIKFDPGLQLMIISILSDSLLLLQSIYWSMKCHVTLSPMWDLQMSVLFKGVSFWEGVFSAAGSRDEIHPPLLQWSGDINLKTTRLYIFPN